MDIKGGYYECECVRCKAKGMIGYLVKGQVHCHKCVKAQWPEKLKEVKYESNKNNPDNANERLPGDRTNSGDSGTRVNLPLVAGSRAAVRSGDKLHSRSVAVNAGSRSKVR